MPNGKMNKHGYKQQLKQSKPCIKKNNRRDKKALHSVKKRINPTERRE